MRGFLLRRARGFVLTVWVVLTVSFFLMRAVPGGPFDGDRALHPLVEENLQRRYHLDWPAWRQYLQYLGPLNLDERGLLGDRTQILTGVLTGDLGPSYRYRDLTVNDVIAQSLPVSFTLGALALLWALLLGLSGGIAAAVWRGSWRDLLLRLASTLGIALPSFVIAGLLILGFALWLPWAPVAGWGQPRHLVLPSLALGMPFAAYIARLTRAGLLEALAADPIRTAVAKGVPPRTILARHALKAGLLPVVSYLGPATAGILTGSLVIERIFFIPGTGSHFVGSALNRDYTLAMGVTLLYTVLVYGLNTLVDLAYTLLDPRIRIEES